MGEFPAGYEHDLAYVEPSSQVDVSGIISSATRFCPDPNEPYEGRKLYLLCSDADLDHEYGEHVTLTQEEFRAVQIPAMCIGQSWWKSAAKRKMASGQAADAIYSKAILYRWFFRSAGTTTLGPFSGAALYAKSDCTSASGALETADMILGFQSFELINEGGNYDTDLRPNKEYKRNLILGNEKVFGAMIAPGELIEGKNIMVL
jgi:hypothetical protein